MFMPFYGMGEPECVYVFLRALSTTGKKHISYFTFNSNCLGKKKKKNTTSLLSVYSVFFEKKMLAMLLFYNSDNNIERIIKLNVHTYTCVTCTHMCADCVYICML